MSSPIDAQAAAFLAGVASNTAPHPDLTAASVDDPVLHDGAAAGLEGTDRGNADTIGAVSPDGTEAVGVVLGVAGAAGGALGGAISALEKLPQSLLSAGAAAAGSLTGALQGAHPAADVTGYTADTNPAGMGVGGGIGGGAGISPGGGSAGGERPRLAPVVPVTGPSPARPVVPAGAASPVEPRPAPGGGGMMPMPMPMGAGMGGQGGGAAETSAATKKLTTARQPHTEPVAGKIPETRVAVAAKPLAETTVRRVTLPEPKETP